MLTLELIQKRVLISLGTLILLVVLIAGCGTASTGGNSTAGSSSTAAPNPTTAPTAPKPTATSTSPNPTTAPTAPTTTTSPTNGYGTTTGCPNNTVVTAAPTQANVIIQSSDINKTILAHNGDVIEIRLPFGHKWGGPVASQGILQLQPPAGYPWKANNMCIWRFVAQGTGNVQLNFTGQPLCKRGQMCPMFIMVVEFKIDVK